MLGILKLPSTYKRMRAARSLMRLRRRSGSRWGRDCGIPNDRMSMGLARDRNCAPQLKAGVSMFENIREQTSAV